MLLTILDGQPNTHAPLVTGKRVRYSCTP